MTYVIRPHLAEIDRLLALIAEIEATGLRPQDLTAYRERLTELRNIAASQTIEYELWEDR